MQSGQFFERFFSERGNFHIKPNQEVDVLCPFPHDKGYETNPSAHVNVDKGIFHCKTCRAEGRFSNGGLSEIAFLGHIYNVSYEQAIHMMTAFEEIKNGDDKIEAWDKSEDNLHINEKAMKFLKEQRGLTEETVRRYRLGYVGEGIAYPILMHGELCDVRTYNYNPNPEVKEPKIKSQNGASPLLFPFDHWRKDDRPTVLVGGENDALIVRQMGFNGLTVTAGEGNFPRLFAGMFKGKKVYICYDCDEAGRKGGRTVAFYLQEAGAEVYIIDLGLPGTKESKDVTDFFVKLGKSSQDFTQKLEEAKLYSYEDFSEDKNAEYPLVDLWEVYDGKYSGRRVSSRVMLMGRYDIPMQTPTSIEYKCKPDLENNPLCEKCPNKTEGSGWWTLEDDNLNDVLELIETTPEKRHRTMKRLCHIPEKCPSARMIERTKKNVRKMVFAPDVETEGIDDFKETESYAYVLEKPIDNKHDLEDGGRYRIFYRRYMHPNDDQRIYLIVDRAEASDNAVNAFKMTESIKDSLKVFQGNPFEKMKDRYNRLQSLVRPYAPEMVLYAVDIMYHSPLQMKFHGSIERGYPEGLVVGETRTGKSKTAEMLQRFYGIGNFLECKTASTAGLLGGADKLPNGGHRIKWGTIPRNNKGLVVLDELSGMAQQVMASLTGLRSSGIAKIDKIVGGRAPAHTRMLWISNQRVQNGGMTRSLSQYNSGVQVILELIGSAEDIARFDFCMLIGDTGEYYSPTREYDLQPYDKQLYRQLIHWVWSRNAEQVVWEPGVEEYVAQTSKELNEAYDCNVKFFGAEAWKKLARISASVAGACFSCSDDGESIVITKEHVDWAANFLRNCYDNDLFRLATYVQSKKVYETTNEQVDNLVASLIGGKRILMKALADKGEWNLYQLEVMSGLEKQEFKDTINSLVQNYLIEPTSNGIQTTKRFALAVQNYRSNYAKTRMVPLIQAGGSGV